MIKIENRIISSLNPIVIPEIGINHNGSLKNAFKIVDAAKRAGAEIIKHQTHIPEDEMSSEAKQIKPGNSNKSIYEIIKSSALNAEDEFKLMKYVKFKKMIFISTPFSRAAVDRLIKFNVPAFKIGSGEMLNIPLIEHVCKSNKLLIVSTGMHSIKQVKKIYDILKKKRKKFALLHTTNLYPTKDHHLRLNSVRQLINTFKDIPIGLSDHTSDLLSSIVGLTLGASIIEKHFVHNKKIIGPDISSSIDENQLRELINFSKRIPVQLKGNKNLLQNEQVTRNFAYSSVVSIDKINKGEIFNRKNLWVKRPGTGYFKASEFKDILGKKAKKNIKNNVQLKKNDVE